MPANPPTASVRALVASPSLLIVNGMCELLRELGDVLVCATATCAVAAMESARRLRPEVILLDREMLAAIRAKPGGSLPVARLVLISARTHRGEERIAGLDQACGLVHERAPPQDLRAMLTTAVRCPLAAPGGDACDTCELRQTQCPPELPLSPREYEVFVRIGRGMGSSGIATALGLSVKTVETHRESIKRKLTLPSSSALVEAAVLWRRGETWLPHRPED